MPDTRIEDLGVAESRIRGQIIQRLGRNDVLVLQATHDQSAPVRSPDQVVVFADDARTRRTTGTPLLVTVHSDDLTLWPEIDTKLQGEGFERFGPMSLLGDQCYESRMRAWFVVPVHPNASMAVERTGKAVLGWIVNQ